MRRTIIFAAALAIIVLGVWGSAVLLLDEDRLKGLVAERLSDGIGRKVEIVGSLSLSLFPSPRIEAEQVLIGPRAGRPGPDLVSADALAMALRVRPLIRGRIVPGQVVLRGATVSLQRGEDGQGDLEDLARVASNASLFADGGISLDDVAVVISGDQSRPAERLDIQRIELSRFVMDRNAEFRFRGSIVEPPLIEDLRVDASLHVPSRPDEPVVLRDFRLSGVLPGSGAGVGLEGELRFRRDGPFAVELAEATLGLDGQNMAIQGSYQAGEPGRLALVATAAALDGRKLVAALPANLGYWRLPQYLARGPRVRAQFRLGRLEAGWLPLTDVRLDLNSESGGLGLGFAAAFAGGLIEAEGLVAAGATDPLPVEIALADTAAALEAASLPPVLDASGEAQLSLRWPTRPEEGPALEGPFRLFDGRWELVDADGEARTLSFDELSGRLLLQSGHLDLPMLSVTGEALNALGWAGIDLSSGALAGELEALDDSGPMVLSGNLAETRLAPRAISGEGTEMPRPEGEDAIPQDAPGR